MPRLICYLMSTSGTEIDRLPRFGRVNNITQKTFLVTKESKEVLCIAIGDRTGSVQDTRKLNIISVPFKVKSLEQVKSIIDSSITVRWLHIPSNETGDPSQGEKFLLRYELVWWDKTIENLGNETVLNLGLPGTQIQNQSFYKKDNYVYFTLSGLNMKHRYGIVVYGVNSLGNGPETEINTAFRPKHIARCAPTVIELRSLEDKKTISSPSYPSPYDHNLNCSYYIYGLLGTKIKIDFEMFQLHSDSSSKCNADRIETYKRSEKSIELVETQCGKQDNLTIKHLADFMRLNFITMKGNSGSQGFKANVYMVPDSKSSKATSTERAILTVLVCYLVTFLM
ncbi:uncharacterized protein LOC130636446 [Hydractinia symbiolongicarpus]|uniref:uncharacterized protein LOC130636446 n=1 Tax=Hydractinia symbiolongicarpus TaxID=13093 RepID=UPI002550DF61|nr:uncharacterized protein LOC130636446 [Hydractinia symbiolongicarpus]